MFAGLERGTREITGHYSVAQLELITRFLRELISLVREQRRILTTDGVSGSTEDEYSDSPGGCTRLQ